MSENLSEDYKEFKKEIQKSVRAKDKIEGNIESNFKKHHKSLYTISLLLSKIRKKALNENEFIYLQEIVSDLLNITKLVLLGWELPSLILLRRVIENFYSHIYFSDHSVEYLHLLNGKNEYMPIDRLKIYLDTHPIFFKSEDALLKEYNQKIFIEYQDLCKIVHSKGSDFMDLSLTLRDLRPDFDVAKLLKRLFEIELLMLYLIYKFHKSIKLTQVEKSILVSLIPADKRALLDE